MAFLIHFGLLNALNPLGNPQISKRLSLIYFSRDCASNVQYLTASLTIDSPNPRNLSQSVILDHPVVLVKIFTLGNVFFSLKLSPLTGAYDYSELIDSSDALKCCVRTL